MHVTCVAMTLQVGVASDNTCRTLIEAEFMTRMYLWILDMGTDSPVMVSLAIYTSVLLSYRLKYEL